MSTSITKRSLEYYALKEEIEAFLYHEAELLDERRFTEWLDLLADDLVYFMPLRRNVRFGDQAEHENTQIGRDISWFDEDKWTLSKRVEQIMTGIHWAEEPLSRVCHLVTNVHIVEIRPSVEAPHTVVVRSRFLVYVNRLQTETNFHVGKRTDTLRKEEDGWKIVRRELILDQNVLLAKNLTVFF